MMITWGVTPGMEHEGIMWNEGSFLYLNLGDSYKGVAVVNIHRTVHLRFLCTKMKNKLKLAAMENFSIAKRTNKVLHPSQKAKIHP